jgi:ATP-dependent exoDNAse (exonuclease V) beta subunit
LLKIGKLNLRGKTKEWFKKFVTTLADWPTMKVAMLLKYGIVDKEEVRAKLDQIKQEPKQKVQACHDRMEKIFTRGKLEDAKKKHKFLSRFRPEIRKLCVVRDYVNMDELLSTVLEVERVLAELGETPLELMKDEQE